MTLHGAAVQAEDHLNLLTPQGIDLETMIVAEKRAGTLHESLVPLECEEWTPKWQFLRKARMEERVPKVTDASPMIIAQVQRAPTTGAVDNGDGISEWVMQEEGVSDQSTLWCQVFSIDAPAPDLSRLCHTNWMDSWFAVLNDRLVDQVRGIKNEDLLHVLGPHER